MSAMKAAPKRAAPSETEDEVEFIMSSKRHATTQASSSKKKSKAPGSTSKVSPSSSSNPTTVLDNLNTKVFPLNLVSLPEDSLETIQSVQSDILQAMSQLFHLGERMDDHGSLKADIAALTYQLRTLAASENVSLREQLERQEEEVCDLRCAAETFDVEKAMAVTGGRVVTRWELMRECLNHQTDSWDLEVALEQYKMVKTSEAELQGLSAPSFEGGLMIPGKNEAEKTPEPTADDPPIDCVGGKYYMKILLQVPGSCSRFRVLAPGIEFLQIPGRTPASGSPLGDVPGPRWKVLRVRSQGPPPSSRKWKYSDKGILPYSRIWKSLTQLADQDRPRDDLLNKYRSVNLKKVERRLLGDFCVGSL
ncbi:hypothetical protein DY000_02030817 [Brassica cretica]|uniref:Uncharacterized protein n=1 Tax=Brassica cretica TaxID=69181 RepID=A0ABQ7DX73_BRACR|nr:hypothetical protein DY000_02030817 [Brassica cretica]